MAKASLDLRALVQRLAQLGMTRQLALLLALQELPADDQAAVARWLTAAEELLS